MSLVPCHNSFPDLKWLQNLQYAMNGCPKFHGWRSQMFSFSKWQNHWNSIRVLIRFSFRFPMNMNSMEISSPYLEKPQLTPFRFFIHIWFLHPWDMRHGTWTNRQNLVSSLWIDVNKSYETFAFCTFEKK